MRIVLDMDEVLTDFLGAMTRAWGTSELELSAFRNPSEWDMRPALLRYLSWAGRLPDEWGNVLPTMDQLFAPIADRTAFWANLEPLPWAEELLRLVRETTNDWVIVTSPQECEGCYAGKVRWLKNYFGASFHRFAILPDKYLFSAPGSVLIDDNERNCRDFVLGPATGDGCRIPCHGRSILFPRSFNSARRYIKEPVQFVATSLRGLLGESTKSRTGMVKFTL